MTIQEFSNEFDILYNNIMSNAAPGVDEYEKSVFLTKAQLEIIRNYFNPESNKNKQGFDDSPKRQIDFSSIIKTTTPSTYTGIYTKFDDRSKVYSLPSDLLYIINESATVTVNNVSKNISIIPLTFSQYLQQINKPYKQPLKNQGWRLILNAQNGPILGQGDTKNNVAEVIINPNYILSKYKIRYIFKPNPIILTDLMSMGLSIAGMTMPSECQLDSSVHQEILQRAVELAKSAYMGDLNTNVELGQRIE